MTERFGIYFMDVGQGDCSLLCPPSTPPVLVDCADATTALHFVRDLRIKALSAVIVSHLDQDHIAGMHRFLADFLDGGGEVGALYINMDRRDLSEMGRNLLEQALTWNREGLLRLHPPMRETKPKLVCHGSGWTIDIVLPRYERVLASQVAGRNAPNLVSAAVRVRCFEKAVLVGGDVPLGSWEELEPRLLKADVLRVPHHGGSIDEGAMAWTAQDLYRDVAPRIAVFSVGTTNRHGHPLPEHMRAAMAGGPCRRVCTQLTARCHPAPERLRRAALRNVASVGYPYARHMRSRGPKEVPCAGSVMIAIDESGTIEAVPPPGPGGWHDAFVDRTAHPMCRTSPAGPEWA